MVAKKRVDQKKLQDIRRLENNLLSQQMSLETNIMEKENKEDFFLTTAECHQVMP